MTSSKVLLTGVLLLSLFSCGGIPNHKKQASETITDTVLLKNIVSFDLSENTGEKKMIGSRSLGNAKTGEKLNDHFAVLNVGEKIAVIYDVKTNCGCIQLKYDKKPIKKGEKSVIRYTYDTRGKNGTQFSEIMIKTNVGNYSVLVDLEIE